MLKIIDKLARSSWKYHFYRKDEVESYVNYLTDSFDYSELVDRKTTLTKLNYYKPGTLYTGKYTIAMRFSTHHVGFKLGAFTKNRKPFYFRSKKKKNVTKKYTVQFFIKYLTS